MSDRRDFLKGAGILGLASLSKGLPAQSRRGDQSAAPDNGLSDVSSRTEVGGTVLENAEMRLVISSSGSARSLIHKPTGQECLVKGTDVSMFNVTQYRPYDNELQLAYPAKPTHFPAEKVRKEGDRLIVDFALCGFEALISLKITDDYIAFRLEDLASKGHTYPNHIDEATRYDHVDEAVFLQLPIRTRTNFGEWLNVMWDEEVAVNVLATDPRTRIDATPCAGHYLLHAGSVRDVQLTGIGAALITTATPRILDRIARVEEDFNLPRGVESRRCKEYRFSNYLTSGRPPQDVDGQIKYVKLAGFRTMDVPHEIFLEHEGPPSWTSESLSGMPDVKRVLAKISAAGIIPGFHILGTLVSRNGPYVTPKPDPRLNLRRSFTLAEDIDATSSVILIEEDPRLCTMENGKRILRIQNELITYERFTANAPFQFEGCQRGAIGTQAGPHEGSSRVGLLDMYTAGLVRLSQNTNIEAEVAKPLQEIYKQAGLKFMYYDGSEQVPPPYWYTVSRAQKIIYDGLEPKPLFGEGSCKSHFSWHILTRGNAFDSFPPEEMKAGIRSYPAAEAPRVAKDFTSINFGWLAYWVPGEKTIGTQPDMLEYATSRAAAWDCPISLSRGPQNLLQALQAHPRTPDNLEVIRRWEEVRAQSWLTEKQKMALRDLDQEHTLLIDEQGKFVLAPWEQIENVAGAKQPGRAFLFQRNGNIWVAYWHTSGEGVLQLPIAAKQATLMRELGESTHVKGNGKQLKVPLGERRYLEFSNLDRQEVIRAFQNAKILST
jgi:hypothetical protein